MFTDFDFNLTLPKKAEADKMAAEHTAEEDKVRFRIRFRIRIPSMSLSNTRVRDRVGDHCQNQSERVS